MITKPARKPETNNPLYFPPSMLYPLYSLSANQSFTRIGKHKTRKPRNMPENQPKRRWLKPIIALIIIAAFTTWFIPWANRRMNTMPPTLEQAYARFGPLPTPTPDEETTQVLANTCNALSPLPTINETPPPGMKWKKDLTGRNIFIDDINRGQWTPENRPNLKACIKYLNSQPIDTALNNLDKVRGKHWQQRFLFDFMNTSNSSQLVEPFDIRTFAKTLTARARYRFIEQHDINKAWDELKTNLWLAKSLEQDYILSFLIGVSIEKMVFEELNHLIREADIPKPLARDIKQTINHRLNLKNCLPALINGEKVFTYTLLAACYADLPDGNGWLVLSNGPFDYIPGFYNTNTIERHRLWNLTTVCHNRFNTVKEKIDLIYDELAKASTMNYMDGKAHIENWESSDLIDSRDGPTTGFVGHHWYERTYILTHQSLAYRNAALITLALKILHEQNGQYPKTLPTEIDGWFGQLPLDPFSGEPFKYRCEDGQNYTLWSVGPNGIDNNGTPQFNGTVILTENTSDLLFSLDRDDPLHDTVAIPVKPTKINPNGAQP